MEKLLGRWAKALEECSSPWCPPPLWWCVGSVLAGWRLSRVTRLYQGAVTVPATNLANWDMLALIRLLESDAFPGKVREAAHIMDEYTRRDLAHERFDCDWHRDWTCMADLLDGLGQAADAAELRKFCETKPHTTDNGERHNTHSDTQPHTNRRVCAHLRSVADACQNHLPCPLIELQAVTQAQPS